LLTVACAPDQATAPHAERRPGRVAGDVAAPAEQLLYNQPPVAGTNVFTGQRTGIGPEQVLMDFVVPPGGNWRTTRFVLVGQAFQFESVGLFQVNVYRDNGSGEPGNVLASSISTVPTAPADPCCAGDVFDYSRALTLDLPPGKYWVSNRIATSSFRTFNPQLAVAVGSPALIGKTLPNDLIAVDIAPPNNDFAFAVYGSVETATEAATGLQTTIEGFGLPSEVLTPLLAKLQSALKALADGDRVSACGSLQALINLASAQSGKKLTEAQATAIINEATRIRTIAGC
jgi:hypothetical protein